MKQRNRHPKRPKMLRQMVLRIPKSTRIDELDKEVIRGLEKGLVQFGGKVSGSGVYLGKIIVVLLAYITKAQFDNFTEANNLDWKILAVEGIVVNQTQILKFMKDVNTYDEDGEITGTEPMTDITGKLLTFAGHKWTYS